MEALIHKYKIYMYTFTSQVINMSKYSTVPLLVCKRQTCPKTEGDFVRNSKTHSVEQLVQQI